MSTPAVVPSRVEDRYPTRLDHAIAPILRSEPVVWGRDIEGPLRSDELARFDERGYLVRPDTLPGDSIGPLCGETDRIAAALELGDPRIIREPRGSIRSIFEPHLLSELVAQAVGLETVISVARQLLGGDVYVHQARINVMPGFTGTGFYWHSDFETWHAEDGMADIRAVSCSITLTRNYPY
ncbi:MAG: hypothetical protein EKK51_02755 [Mycolicibacterium sp.]|nr:MAG: hypothetical protein EKK51_02755 [Mycolicibacterium sp.]